MALLNRITQGEPPMEDAYTHPIESSREGAVSVVVQIVNKIINTYVFVFHVLFRPSFSTAS